MPRVAVETLIDASPDRCFDLARDLDLHLKSLVHTGERAVAGKTTGPIGLGDEVTWRGRHFGIVLHHTATITAFDRPQYFRDEMVRGHFRSFRHDHYFRAESGGTRMSDILEFQSPFGPLGRLLDLVVMAGYLKRLLQTRNAVTKAAAEKGV